MVRGQGGRGRALRGFGEGSHLYFLSQLLPCEQPSVPPGHGASLTPVPLTAALGMLGGGTQHILHIGPQGGGFVLWA